jgi:hypothetical protein
MYKSICNKTGFLLAVAGATIAGGVTTVLVQAAIPSASDGQIHACYRTNTGAIRVVDSDTGQTCTNQETSLNWSAAASSSAFVNNLTGADFSLADLRYRVFSGKNLTGSNLTNTKISGADFSNANLSNTDFTSADAQPDHGANFTGANFAGSQLDITSGANINFSSSNFTNVDFSNRNFSGVNLFRANLQNVNFSNTHLSGLSMGEAANATTANFSGATWQYVTCPDATNSEDHGSTCIGHLVP